MVSVIVLAKIKLSSFNLSIIIVKIIVIFTHLKYIYICISKIYYAFFFKNNTLIFGYKLIFFS